MGALLNILGRKWKRLRDGWELNKYDRFTIAEYLRERGAQIGDQCSIIPTRLGTEPYLVKIGNHVTIASGVKFHTHDGGAWLMRKEIPDLHVFGTIIIDDNCVIGENAILMPNIHIGSNSIVGAGSVVISDIPADSIAMGVPARVISTVYKYQEKCRAKWLLQKPPDMMIEEGKTWWNSKYYPENVIKLRRHLLQVFAPKLFSAENDGANPTFSHLPESK